MKQKTLCPEPGGKDHIPTSAHPEEENLLSDYLASAGQRRGLQFNSISKNSTLLGVVVGIRV